MFVQWPWVEWKRNRKLLHEANYILAKQKIALDISKDFFLSGVLESVESVLEGLNISEWGYAKDEDTAFAFVLSNSDKFLKQFEVAIQIAYTMTFVRLSGHLNFGKLFSVYDDRVYEEEERLKLLWPTLLVIRHMLLENPVGQDRQNYSAFSKVVNDRSSKTERPVVITAITDFSSDFSKEVLFEDIKSFYGRQTAMLLNEHSTVYLFQVGIKSKPVVARRVICQE